jgi:hypothetical protein
MDQCDCLPGGYAIRFQGNGMIGKVYKEMERDLCRTVLGRESLSVRLFRLVSHPHHNFSSTIFRQ